MASLLGDLNSPMLAYKELRHLWVPVHLPHLPLSVSLAVLRSPLAGMPFLLNFTLLPLKKIFRSRFENSLHREAFLGPPF